MADLRKRTRLQDHTEPPKGGGKVLAPPVLSVREPVPSQPLIQASDAATTGQLSMSGELSSPRYARGGGPHVNQYVLKDKQEKRKKELEHVVRFLTVEPRIKDALGPDIFSSIERLLYFRLLWERGVTCPWVLYQRFHCTTLIKRLITSDSVDVVTQEYLKAQIAAKEEAKKAERERAEREVREAEARLLRDRQKLQEEYDREAERAKRIEVS